MKKQLVLMLILIGLASPSMAQELPQPSPYAEVHQRVGLTDMVVTYSRPHMRDRVIFGDLVPYNEVWRAGANMATTLEISAKTMIGDTEVEAGKYGIFITPSEKTWKVMFNKVWDTGGTGDYDAANDVATVEVEVQQTPAPIQSYTIWFANVNEDKAHLVFMWENSMVAVPLNSPSADLAKANIEAKMEEMKGAFRTYNNIARYNLEHGENANALEMAKKSVEMDERFWNVKVLSEAYAANGDKKMAIKTAERSLELSKEADYKPYIKMNEENIAKWKAEK